MADIIKGHEVMTEQENFDGYMITAHTIETSEGRVVNVEARWNNRPDATQHIMFGTRKDYLLWLTDRFAAIRGM